MMIYEVAPERLRIVAPCHSSVLLWAKSSSVEFLEIAASSGDAECLAVFAAFDQPRLWISHLCGRSTEMTAYARIVDWVRSRFPTIDSTRTIAIVQHGDIALQALRSTGWAQERDFPVELQWNSLLGVRPLAPPAGISISMAGPEEAAHVFIAAFSEQWRWYFREMGCAGTVGDSETIRLATRYMASAEFILVATDADGGVGVTSAARTADGGAEFHTGVGVLPRGRERGIGRALVVKTLDWAASFNARTMQVRTQRRLGVENRNITMYESHGAVPIQSFALLRPSTCAT